RRAAEAAFHRALSADRHHGPALIGLSELYFDRADYYRAMEYAARAVRVKPKDAGYHLALGDAYYRLLRFSEAKQHYTPSRRLGHPQARARLAKVARKLGTEPYQPSRSTLHAHRLAQPCAVAFVADREGALLRQ